MVLVKAWKVALTVDYLAEEMAVYLAAWTAVLLAV